MYKLLRNSSSVLRLADRATIPDDPRNADRHAFILWRDGWAEKLEDGTELAHPPHEPEPADLAPEPTQDELDAAAARQYAKLAALKNMTPAQVDAWIDANIRNFVDAKDALKTLAIAVGILVRRI